jgi:hypothetical protein
MQRHKRRVDSSIGILPVQNPQWIYFIVGSSLKFMNLILVPTGIVVIGGVASPPPAVAVVVAAADDYE